MKMKVKLILLYPASGNKWKGVTEDIIEIPSKLPDVLKKSYQLLFKL